MSILFLIAFICRFIINRVQSADWDLLYEDHPYSPLNAFLIAFLITPKSLITEGWFAGCRRQNSKILHSWYKSPGRIKTFKDMLKIGSCLLSLFSVCKSRNYYRSFPRSLCNDMSYWRWSEEIYSAGFRSLGIWWPKNSQLAWQYFLYI